MTVRASSDGGEAIALFTDEDDIVIKNGSIVDALAEGRFSTAISTRNYYPNDAGGHIYISDSVVKAIARYAEIGGDGPDHYSGDQDGEIVPEREGLNIGISAQTSEGITPATISIVRSKVTAEGDTAAIFALAMSADGKAIGTIEIEGAIIQTPEGGKVIDYRNKEELSDGISYEAGQTIGTGDATIDSPYDAAVAKSAVIAPLEEAKPEANPEETTPVVKPAKQQTLVTGAKAEEEPPCDGGRIACRACCHSFRWRGCGIRELCRPARRVRCSPQARIRVAIQAKRAFRLDDLLNVAGASAVPATLFQHEFLQSRSAGYSQLRICC